jgi:hypothetical protein
VWIVDVLHEQEQSAKGRAIEMYCISVKQMQVAGDAVPASESGGLLGQ